MLYPCRSKLEKVSIASANYIAHFVCIGQLLFITGPALSGIPNSHRLNPTPLKLVSDGNLHILIEIELNVGCQPVSP